ncbi:hypothetical protein THAOC_29476 [Thalassiosira oceanica]|uniref:Uncharacterized protein n=1 Tax=Thalassiosira oceanica TaxID=159749 RepID=K0RCA4_THAOC|nr:hypothetical protein THAOC_29476 [Thalassiosira oceanica]|eukprot:EJK51358.1 hypothetical protein THAOC_29476 [Thalassiosira oceanica]
MPSAPATGLSSLELGLDSTSQKSTPTPTEVDPVYVERRDNFEIASAGTQCRGISLQPTCFTLLVAGRNPFGGTLGNYGDTARPVQGRAVLAFPGPVGPGSRSFHKVGATQRNDSITCFSSSRKEGWTYFYPKRRNEIDCQDLPGLVLTRCRPFGKCLSNKIKGQLSGVCMYVAFFVPEWIPIESAPYGFLRISKDFQSNPKKMPDCTTTPRSVVAYDPRSASRSEAEASVINVKYPQIQQVFSAMNPLLAYALAPIYLSAFYIPRGSGKTTWEPASTPTYTATPCFRVEISGSEPPGTPQIQRVFGAMNPLLAYALAPMHLSAFYIPRGSGKTTWEPTSTSTSIATTCFLVEISGSEPPGTPQIQQVFGAMNPLLAGHALAPMHLPAFTYLEAVENILVLVYRILSVCSELELSLKSSKGTKYTMESEWSEISEIIETKDGRSCALQCEVEVTHPLTSFQRSCRGSMFKRSIPTATRKLRLAAPCLLFAQASLTFAPCKTQQPKKLRNQTVSFDEDELDKACDPSDPRSEALHAKPPQPDLHTRISRALSCNHGVNDVASVLAWLKPAHVVEVDSK